MITSEAISHPNNTWPPTSFASTNNQQTSASPSTQSQQPSSNNENNPRSTLTITINITQDQNNVKATATATNGTIDASAWAHTTPSTTNPTCATATYNQPGSDQNSHSITQADNNKYICFRTKDNRKIYAYGKHQIDFNPPTIHDHQGQQPDPNSNHNRHRPPNNQSLGQKPPPRLRPHLFQPSPRPMDHRSHNNKRHHQQTLLFPGNRPIR